MVKSMKIGVDPYADQAADIDFNADEFYIESRRVLPVGDVLVNCFKLDDDRLLFILKKSIMVASNLLIPINKVKLNPAIGQLRCFTTDYNCDGKHFLKGFISKEDVLRSHGVPLSHCFDEMPEVDS